MTRDDALILMLNSVNDDNREFCARNGMSEEDTEAQVAQSQPTLHVILGNMYDRMKTAGIIG